MHPEDVVAVVERGERAGSLLRNGDFLGVVDDLSNYHLAALVAAPPGEAAREARDHHHLMHHALTQIVAELRDREAAALDLAQRVNDEDD